MTALDDMIEAALAPIRAGLEQRLSDAKKARAEVEARADALELGNVVAATFASAGGNPMAREYIAHEAAKDFELKDGQAVARAGLFSVRRPWESLSLAEWCEAAKTTHHAFAFEKSKSRTRR